MADIEQINVWLTNSTKNNKTKTMTVQSQQPTHCSVQVVKNSDICAPDMEKISICLASKTGNEIIEIMTYLKSPANASESCKQDDNGGVYADDTGQTTM